MSAWRSTLLAISAPVWRLVGWFFWLLVGMYMGSIIGFQVRWGLQTAAVALLGSAVWGWSVTTKADNVQSASSSGWSDEFQKLPAEARNKLETDSGAMQEVKEKFESQAHAQKQMPEEKNDEKNDQAKKDVAEKVVQGITVNNQPLYEQTVDGKNYRYYYVNGDTKSPFISMEKADGSFEWTTKNTMLGKNTVDLNGMREIGMIETSGQLSKMYELPNGGRAFKNGDLWSSSAKGENSFSTSKTVTGQQFNSNFLRETKAKQAVWRTDPMAARNLESPSLWTNAEVPASAGYSEAYKYPSSASPGGQGKASAFTGSPCANGRCTNGGGDGSELFGSPQPNQIFLGGGCFIDSRGIQRCPLSR